MNLRQRLDSLEQILQEDPARDLEEQLEAFRAENGLTARDTLVIVRHFDFSDED